MFDIMMKLKDPAKYMDNPRDIPLLSVAELRKGLQSRGLSGSGRKAVLVKRLQNWISEQKKIARRASRHAKSKQARAISGSVAHPHHQQLAPPPPVDEDEKASKQSGSEGEANNNGESAGAIPGMELQPQPPMKSPLSELPPPAPVTTGEKRKNLDDHERLEAPPSPGQL